MLRIILVFIMSLAFYSSPARAQVDPSFVNLATLTVQLADSSAQVGDLSAFGFAVQRDMLAQTYGTGRYNSLAGLGLQRGAVLVSALPLPSGFIAQARVFHDYGYSDWTVGYAYASQKIEYATFNFAPYNWGGSIPMPTPTSAVPGPPPSTPSAPSSPSAGCQKYPTLC